MIWSRHTLSLLPNRKQQGIQEELSRSLLLRGSLQSHDDDDVVPRGLEPRTLRLLAVRSDQLSDETF